MKQNIFEEEIILNENNKVSKNFPVFVFCVVSFIFFVYYFIPALFKHSRNSGVYFGKSCNNNLAGIATIFYLLSLFLLSGQEVFISFFIYIAIYCTILNHKLSREKFFALQICTLIVPLLKNFVKE